LGGSLWRSCRAHSSCLASLRLTEAGSTTPTASSSSMPRPTFALTSCGRLRRTGRACSCGWKNNASASQEFDLIFMGNDGRDFFQIRARHSGKCLMLQKNQGKVGNGTRIAQYPCSAATYRSAQWYFNDVSGNCEADALCSDSGRRVIKNRYVPKCIDTANPSGKRPGQQAILQLWTCVSSPSTWNADNQIWKIIDPVTKRPITEPR
jgi:hypothetical protein